MKSLTKSPTLWQLALLRLNALGNAISKQGKKKADFRTGRTSNTRYTPERNINFFQL